MSKAVQLRSGLVRPAGAVLGLALLAPGLAAVAAVSAPKPASATPAPVTVTFSATGAAQSFTVPSGVSTVRVTADGASGGSGGGSTQAQAGSAGRGGEASATMLVDAGQVLTVVAAQFGASGGSNGGGGGSGGPSSTPIMNLAGGSGGKPDGSVSGGGGGGGGASGVFLGSTVLVVGSGGGGGGGAGGVVGLDGGSGGSFLPNTAHAGSNGSGFNGGLGGGGGTQATTYGGPGQNAALSDLGGGGGGGGGGYQSGGGGGNAGQIGAGGGGGGGSGASYVNPSTPVSEGAFAASPLDGPGRVTITYAQRAATTTTVTSSSQPSVYGQPVTFTARVTTTSGAPATGLVGFVADGSQPILCQEPSDPDFGPFLDLQNGVASCTPTQPLPTGGHVIIASYLVNDDFQASQGSVPQPVNQAATTTAVSSSVNPSLVGQPVTFTAVVAPVAPGAGVPTGTVNFSDGPNSICASSTVVAGSTTCTTSALTGGTHPILATYDGDQSFTGSSSNPTSQQVTAAPVANDDSYEVSKNNPLTVAAPGVLANDTDPNGNSLSAVLVSGPAHGTLALNANGAFTYTPAAGYSGPDSFTYKANDGQLDSNPATVSLTVADTAPVAANDSYTAKANTALNVPAAGVLGNDTDANHDSLSAVLVSGPAHGTLALNANGAFTYTPAGGYTGPDSFIYKANDGQLDSNVATVSVTVSPPPDAPLTITHIGAIADRHDNAAAGVTFTDADPEGNLSQYSGTVEWGDHSPVTPAQIVKNPFGGFAAGGLHHYATRGTYTVTITIHDVGGATTTRTTSLVAPRNDRH